MDSIKRSYGKALKRERKKAGYKTQQALADEIGMSLETVENWEQGRAFPDMGKFLELCALFNCSADCLLGRIEERTHDLHFIHEETGLSVNAIEKLQANKDRIMPHSDSAAAYESFAAAVSSLIEHKRFVPFVIRLMQSKALCSTIKKTDLTRREEIENAYAVLQKNGYAILGAGENNRVSLYNAKQEIAVIIDDVFEDKKKGYLELRT